MVNGDIKEEHVFLEFCNYNSEEEDEDPKREQRLTSMAELGIVNYILYGKDMDASNYISWFSDLRCEEDAVYDSLGYENLRECSLSLTDYFRPDAEWPFIHSSSANTTSGTYSNPSFWWGEFWHQTEPKGSWFFQVHGTISEPYE